MGEDRTHGERLVTLELQVESLQAENKEQTVIITDIQSKVNKLLENNTKQKGLIGGIVLCASGITAFMSFVKEWGHGIITLLAGK